MAIVYYPQKQTAILDFNENTTVNFFCGNDLDEIGEIVLQLNYRLISPQKAYTLLMREMIK